MVKHFIFILFLIQGFAFAQKVKSVQGIWTSERTLMDPKVGKIILARVKHNGAGFGIFLQFQDTATARFYYSPMCGNSCIWSYDGRYSMNVNKLNLHFETYDQHGFCKKIEKKYKKNEMNFVFLVETKGKDTLVLTRQTK
jgi:hypothetical protein